MQWKTLALVVGLSACRCPLLRAETDLEKLPPPSERQGLTYEKDIRPIFEASCFACHGQERARAGLRLDSLKAVLRGSEDGEILTPGKSRDSLLVLAISQLDDETAMPPRNGVGPVKAPRFGPGGPGGRGGQGGPFGGLGGAPFGGGGMGGQRFGPAQALGPALLAAADLDKDGRLTPA